MDLIVTSARGLQGWMDGGPGPVTARASVTGHNNRMAAIISPGQAEKTAHQGKTGIRRDPHPASGDHGRGRGTEQKGKIA